MAELSPLSFVKPGDLLTAQLINDIIDAIGKLDAKIDKCCKEAHEAPTSPGETPSAPGETPRDPGETVPVERGTPVITRVVPRDASPNDTVAIEGSGFAPNAPGNQVSIGGKVVKEFGRVTETLIEAVVPTLGFRQRSEVDVVVTLENGKEAKGAMSVGPPDTELRTGIALRTVEPAGKMVAGTKYRLGFIVGSTGEDNLTVTASLTGATATRTKALVKKEFSFASRATLTFEVPFTMPKAGGTIEVALLKESAPKERDPEKDLDVVSSESYTFQVDEDPPIDFDRDEWDNFGRRG